MTTTNATDLPKESIELDQFECFAGGDYSQFRVVLRFKGLEYDRLPVAEVLDGFDSMNQKRWKEVKDDGVAGKVLGMSALRRAMGCAAPEV